MITPSRNTEHWKDFLFNDFVDRLCTELFPDGGVDEKTQRTVIELLTSIDRLTSPALVDDDCEEGEGEVGTVLGKVRRWVFDRAKDKGCAITMTRNEIELRKEELENRSLDEITLQKAARSSLASKKINNLYQAALLYVNITDSMKKRKSIESSKLLDHRIWPRPFGVETLKDLETELLRLGIIAMRLIFQADVKIQSSHEDIEEIDQMEFDLADPRFDGYFAPCFRKILGAEPTLGDARALYEEFQACGEMRFWDAKQKVLRQRRRIEGRLGFGSKKLVELFFYLKEHYPQSRSAEMHRLPGYNRVKTTISLPTTWVWRS